MRNLIKHKFGEVGVYNILHDPVLAISQIVDVCDMHFGQQLSGARPATGMTDVTVVATEASHVGHQPVVYNKE